MGDKFALLARIASDWWWEMDADLRFTHFSERFTEVFGIAGAELIGKRRTEADRTDYDNPAWQAHLDDLANRRPFRDFETTFVDAKGVSRPVKISGAPLRDDDGTFRGYIGVGHDLTVLREREKQIAVQAADLQSIIENIAQGIALFDKDLNIVAYNRRVAAWLRLDPGEDLRGKPYEEVVRELARRGEYDPENREEAIARRLELVRSRKPFSGERPNRHGQILSVTYTPLPAGNSLMTYSDVTEMRRRETALAQSEASFRQLFVGSPLPKWVYAAGTLRFLEVNGAAIARYGYSRDEFLAMTLKDIRPPEEVVRLEAWLANRAPQREGAMEWRHRRRDGSVIDVEVSVSDMQFAGQPARLAELVDITARKQAERQTERLFKTSQDVILITDGYGKIVEISPSWTKVLGYQPGEVIGRGAGEFMLPEDLAATQDEMRSARRGRLMRNFRNRYRHKDGHIVPLLWMGVWSEPDRHHFFIGRDMSEYERKDEELRQAQKMEVVGQLTGGVAHDFNNILTVIIGNAEALLEEASLGAEESRQLDEIGRAAQRAADLTRQLLAFSRKQPLRPQITDIDELVSGTGKLLQRALGEHIAIETSLAGGLHPVSVDRAQLETALVNLCLNARDAMPGGGKVRIATRNVRLDEAHAARRPEVAVGDYVALAVTDSGTGMPPEIVEKIFEPFFTTKEVGKGTGLGLSMVYGFIKQSFGDIAVTSEVGRGTTFELYLPRAADVEPRTGRGKAVAAAGGSERILLVEDEPQVRQSVLTQLRSLGYNVTDAPNGPAGLAACEAASRPFDLLLTDVVMPGALNGKALADEVRRRWPSTRVVFMSGYAEDAIVHNGQLDSGVTLIGKPFRKTELARVVRQALD